MLVENSVQTARNKKTKQKGMSLFEVIPVIMVISALIGFVLGFWGVVHKNILHSIAARNYAFETFNHRSNLTYFNDVRDPATAGNSYEQSQMRFHGVGRRVNGAMGALTVPFRFPAGETKNSGNPEIHQQRIWNPSVLSTGQELNPEVAAGLNHVWVMVGYGICLNADCGG